MNGNYIRIEIPDGKIKELMDRIDAAQQEISKCYDELRMLGVVTITEKTASGN